MHETCRKNNERVQEHCYGGLRRKGKGMRVVFIVSSPILSVHCEGLDDGVGWYPIGNVVEKPVPSNTCSLVGMEPVWVGDQRRVSYNIQSSPPGRSPTDETAVALGRIHTSTGTPREGRWVQVSLPVLQPRSKSCGLSYNRTLLISER